MDSRLDKIIVTLLSIVKLVIVLHLKYPYSLEIHTEDFRAMMHAIYSEMV